MDESQQAVSHMVHLSMTKTRLAALITLLLILFGLPLAILAAQTVQTTQQHASGREVVALPTGSKLLFTIHVSGLVPGYPALFYISLKNGIVPKNIQSGATASATGIGRSIGDRAGGDNDWGILQRQLYTTNKDGQILIQVNPSDDLVIRPLLSKGYKEITPESMEVNVLNGKCGISTPCEFTARPIGIIPSITPGVTGTACLPRPICLDAHPRCLLPEPEEGWCPSGTPTPQTSQTPTPTLAIRHCPTLPSICHYTGNGVCKTNDDQPANGSCTCGEIICTGIQ